MSSNITEYPLSGITGASGITSGPDGALWFTEAYTNKVGRITTTGSLSEFSILPCVNPASIVVGPDAALWFTCESNATNGNTIGRIATGGSFTYFHLPDLTPDLLQGITVGSDGAFWFAEEGANKIGRMTTSGVVTEFSTPTQNSNPVAITLGPDGASWFTGICR